MEVTMKRVIVLLWILTILFMHEEAISGDMELGINDVVSIEIPSGGYRVLLTFDIPSGIIESEIDYAKLVIPYSSLNEEIDLELYSVSVPWDRATVSWDYPWIRPGGDYEHYPQSKLHLYPDYPEGKNFFFDVTENLRIMISEDENFGFIIKPSSEYGLSFNEEILVLLEDKSSLIIKFYVSKSES
jgi:hypothetical protein